LEDPGGIDHRATFFDSASRRLLGIHVLAGLTSVNGHQRMPMVRSPDEHCVDIFSVKDAPVIFVKRGGALRNFLSSFREMFLVDVANGGSVFVNVVTPHPTDTNVRRHDPIVGPGPTRSTDNAARDETRRRR
jgi:hypothetical protein